MHVFYGIHTAWLGNEKCHICIQTYPIRRKHFIQATKTVHMKQKTVKQNIT